MASEHNPHLHEDHPLKLLATPAFETGKKDSFTMAASHMVISHNSLIRGFNSIYQQATRIPVSDHTDFIDYSLAWHRLVEEHHYHEEVYYFPAIERATGQKGVMDGEVEQHAAFHVGLKAMKDYLCDPKMPKAFRPSELLKIMDSFSSPLYLHLAAEPQSILALSRFTSSNRQQFDLVAIEQEQGKKAISVDFVFNVMPMFLNNMEFVEFEDGMWKNHPNIPAPVAWILKNLVPMWKSRQWRFMSCSSDGRRKRLVV